MTSDTQYRDNPFTVPRIWILGLSSVLWVIPAIILLRNALLWSDALNMEMLLLSTALAAVGVGLGHVFWFNRIVLGNIRRIRSLPERTKIWHISSSRGYAMIVLMISIGVVLRSSDLPRIYLAGPYALMGGCLLLGSIQIASSFFRELQPVHNDS